MLWGPLLTLGLMGGAYLFECLNSLTDPGTGLVYYFEGRKGPVTLRARSYSIAIFTGQLIARDVTVSAPSDEVVASAEEVALRLPEYLGGDPRFVSAHVRTLRGTLVRDEEGRFSFLDLLPPKREEPSDLPFRVDVRDAVLDIVDRSGEIVWTRRLRLPDTRVDGVGDRWRASGRVIQADGGWASVSILSDPGSEIALDGRFGGFDVAPWLSPVQRSEQVQEWDLLRNLSAERLVVEGPIALRIPFEGSARVEGRLEAAGRRIRYLDLFAETGEMSVRFNNAELDGTIDLAATGARAKYRGVIAWEPEVFLRGDAEIDLRDRNAVPSRFRKDLPLELRFGSGRFIGALAYRENSGLKLQGDVSAAWAAWNEARVDQPTLALHYDGPKISVRGFEGLYEGTRVQGAGDANVDTRTLTAFASTGNVALERFREQTGLEGVRGIATLEARASGTLDDPNLELRAKGLATARLEEGRVVDLGPFHALAHYDEDVLKLDRLAIIGPAGVATATGSYDTRLRKLDLSAVASGVDLARLHSQLSGSAAGIVRITGTPDRFVAKGPVEVYGLTIRDQPVPLVAAEIEVTPERLLAETVRATRGAARLRGRASWTFKTDVLDGDFVAESIQLHDLLAEGNEGSIDIQAGQLTGTLQRPVISGMLAGQDLVLQGVRVDSARGALKIEGSVLEIASSRFAAENGTLEASATYDLETRAGRVSGRATDLPIRRIQPLLPPETGLEGEVHGDFSASIVDARLASFEADGGVQGLSVNRAFLGNGFFTMGAENRVWRGTLEVGQPERLVVVPEFTYREEGDLLDAELLAYGLPLRDLYFASKPYFSVEPGADSPRVELPRNLRDILDRLQGALDMGLKVSGPVGNPDVNIESLTLRDTTVDGESTGQIFAVARRDDQLWTIEKLQWTGGPGLFDVQGTIQEGGTIALDGNLNNFDVQWLQRFIPSFAQITGSGNLFFTVTGQAAEPQIQASLEGSFFEDKLLMERIRAMPEPQRTAELEKARDRQLKMEIFPIHVANGSITLDGRFFYRGFTGTMVGSIPFQYPFTFPDDQEMEVRLRVPERKLDELEPLFTRLDVERTDGAVWADLTLSGTMNDAKLAGGVNLRASSVAFDHVDTVFQDVTATSSLSGQSVQIEAQGKSERGGAVQASARLDLSRLSEAMQESVEALWSSRIDGEVVLSKARVVERNLPLDEAAETVVSTEFVADGTLRISGPLRSPLISTETPLSLEKVKGDIPSVLLVGGESATSEFSPSFNVAYVVGSRDDPAELRAAASVLNLWGTGSLVGPLNDLQANANLRVRSGHIRLPNARIALQEGGTVNLRYDGGGLDPELRLDVDIEGRTALSTIRFGTLIERYDIFIELQGNLLNAEEQTITARSDPPDLSQERIMNLLGQVELVERISGNLIGGQRRRELEQALTGLALPYVFDPLTEELARQLGLEYLSLDYGPLGQTTITAAKWLGKGFFIQASREVSTPIDRVPDYELRLTYRPPRRIRQLRSLTFSLGLDQDRPWKISVDYGGRLPNTGSPNKETRIYIGEPPADKPRPPKP